MTTGGRSEGRPKSGGERRLETKAPADAKAMVLFDELGVKDPKQRNRMTSLILKREVTSWKDVLPEERGTVIDDLNRRLDSEGDRDASAGGG